MNRNNVKTRNRSRVQGSILVPRTAFGMRIYEENVSSVSTETKSGAKLAIICENEHF